MTTEKLIEIALRNNGRIVLDKFGQPLFQPPPGLMEGEVILIQRALCSRWHKEKVLDWLKEREPCNCG